VSRITAIRSLLDIQGDLAMEAAIADVMEDGELQRHVARARRVYAERRHILAGAFRRELGDAAAFRIPSGGMALWVRFAPRVDVELWARRSLALPGCKVMRDLAGEPGSRSQTGFGPHGEWSARPFQRVI